MRHVEVSIQIGVNFLHIDIVYKTVDNWDMDGGRWQENTGKGPNHYTTTLLPQSLITAIVEGSSYDIVGACANAVANDIGLGQTNSNYKNEK